MGLEKQVCNFWLAKQIKHLGIKQESLFWWVEYHNGFIVDTERKNELVKDYASTNSPLAPISAFTVAELGEMLPKKAVSIRDDNTGEFISQIMIYHRGRETEIHREKSYVEADARAKLLIYLIENCNFHIGSEETKYNEN